MKKRILASVLAICMVFSALLLTSAAEFNFPDAPDDYSTAALKAAVENGLLRGTGDGRLLPRGNLLRAEMAAIVNRAFGALEEASLAPYNDVREGAWYRSDMALAVRMRTFVGDGAGLRPEDPILRQDAFVVLARALSLPAADESALDSFDDGDSVSPWARAGVAAMVAAGYVKGDGVNLKPLENITRADFAVVMDNIIKNYITAPGLVKSVGEGSVMIKVPGVTLRGVTVKGDLIIGDGVGEGEVFLEDVTVTGRVIIRAGGVNSVSADDCDLPLLVFNNLGRQTRFVNAISPEKLPVLRRPDLHLLTDATAILVGSVGSVTFTGDSSRLDLTGAAVGGGISVNGSNNVLLGGSAPIIIGDDAKGTLVGGEPVNPGFIGYVYAGMIVLPPAPPVEPPSDASVAAANLHDCAESGAIADDELYSYHDVLSYRYSDYTDVTVISTDLRRHVNGQGVSGFWTGFSVKAPSGATKMSCASGSSRGELSFSPSMPLEQNVDGKGANGVAFYVDMDFAASTGWFAVEWFSADDRSLGVKTFGVSFANVALYNDDPTYAWFLKGQDSGSFVLSSQNDFVYLREKLAAGFDFAGKTLTLGEDIHFSGYWTPMSLPAGKTLVIDGAGHSMLYLKTNSCLEIPTNSVQGSGGSCFYCSGLVGFNAGDLTIKNVTFKYADIRIDPALTSTNPCSKHTSSPNECTAAYHGSSSLAVVVGRNNTGAKLTLDNVNIISSSVSAYTKGAALVGQLNGTVVADSCSVKSFTTNVLACTDDPQAAFNGAVFGFVNPKAALTVNNLSVSGNTYTSASTNWDSTVSENGSLVGILGSDRYVIYSPLWCDGYSLSGSFVATVNGGGYNSFAGAFDDSDSVTAVDGAVISSAVTIPAGKTLTVPAGSTLSIAASGSISGAGRLDVYGTVSADSFACVAPALAAGMDVRFYAGSTLKVWDAVNNRFDSFIGANTMSVDTGYASFSLNGQSGFTLTIPSGSSATIKGHHMDGDNNGYRIAKADKYSVAGSLVIAYDTELSGTLEIVAGGTVTVNSGKTLSLFTASGTAGRVANAGSLVNNGTVLVGSGSSVVNTGAGSTSGSGSFAGEGTWPGKLLPAD